MFDNVAAQPTFAGAQPFVGMAKNYVQGSEALKK
jgi:hypothetical protein